MQSISTAKAKRNLTKLGSHKRRATIVDSGLLEEKIKIKRKSKKLFTRQSSSMNKSQESSTLVKTHKTDTVSEEVKERRFTFSMKPVYEAKQISRMKILKRILEMEKASKLKTKIRSTCLDIMFY